ncbi:hypothetical protein PPERSA_00326 [Pseudocohnilembus persalinus]|uniref:Uncharacterized protein n=1 Tax=Pseudocohnilembus persalinus TaxID=266149 RepID=A0A0V0QH44_PSEPJ|nr:hypothetical protein PPERSA_00326 [Pseudocohnilembus persalinus]|eukprot:KRX01619.1 hypothetical protein PPERSA_00326 [Pseudocohnilembus persalinus]
MGLFDCFTTKNKQQQMNLQQVKNFNIENTKIDDNITNYTLSYSPQLSQNSINNSIPVSHTSLNKKNIQEIKNYFNSQIFYSAFVKHTTQNQIDFSLEEAKRFKIAVDQQIQDQQQKLFDKLQEELEMNDFILGDDYMSNQYNSDSLHKN